ncbi:MAG: hypothetical protein KIH67_000130 [Candidatus Moranbacteria bacterium]|nr:hypothetical protein [Candidatus Moranbacteria bacterium]
MNRQEILYLILGVALGSLLTSLFLLRAPLVSKQAYDLGLRMKSQPVVTEQK